MLGYAAERPLPLITSYGNACAYVNDTNIDPDYRNEFTAVHATEYYVHIPPSTSHTSYPFCAMCVVV